jgi:hypothetical protein
MTNSQPRGRSRDGELPEPDSGWLKGELEVEVGGCVRIPNGTAAGSGRKVVIRLRGLSHANRFTLRRSA